MTARLMYLRAMDGDPGQRNPEEPALLAASRAEFLTPLDRFGPSRHIYGRVIKPVQACTCSLRHAWAPTIPSPRWVGRAMTIGRSRSGALTVTATATSATRLDRPQRPPRSRAWA